MTRLSLFALLIAVSALPACEGEIKGSASGPCKTPEPKVRRLTRAELDATLTDSLGAPVAIGPTLAAEDMQLGYFGHDSLQVTTLFADQLDTATAALAKERAPTVKCNTGEAERDCAKRTLSDIASKAWRRPLDSSEVDELLALYDAGKMGETHEVGMSLALQGIFESTGTLYRTEIGDTQSGKTVKLSQWEIASEISFLAAGIPPDAPLRDAAAAGTLSKPEVRVEHLKRLLETPEAVARMRDFVVQWFGITNMSKVQKNNEYFPKFDTALRDSMTKSATKFIEASMSGTHGSVKDLLAADYTYADAPLADFLGSAEMPAMMSRISMTGLPRLGLVTHPALLSVYAHNDDGSPTLRGKMVRTRLLCDNIPPPPPNVVASVAPVSPDSTTRERAMAHANNDTCKSCHNLMDPIGFGLEGYDGFGEYRISESSKPIDDSGEIQKSDISGPFKGGVELARKLSGSKQVGDCATRQITRFAIGRHETANDQCMVDGMLKKYDGSQGSLYSALEGLVESDAFVQRTVSQ